MIYQITYQPFITRVLNQLGTQKITVNLNEENLAGLLLMSSQVIGPDRISITGSANFNIFNYVGRGRLKYSGKFVTLDVQFNTLDGFQGAIFLCNLLGLPWQTLIKEIHLTSSTYLHQILLRSPENSVNVLDLPKLGLNLYTTNSLIRNGQDCFHSYLEYYLPTNVYTSSLDPDQKEVVASVAITTNKLTLPHKYQNEFYIYNACTYTPYQGKGLMKSLLIMMINQVLQNNQEAKIYLKVRIDNHVAYKLYLSLGFITIEQVRDPRGPYHLMQFSIIKF